MSGRVLKPLSGKEVGEFFASLAQQVPAELFDHPEQVRRYLRRTSELGKVLRQVLLEKVEALDLDHHLALWQRVYWEICGIEPRLQDIRLPDDPGGFGWPIVATPEVPLNSFWQGLQQKFPCWCYGSGNDLEALLDWQRQQRSYKDGAYCVRVRDRVEADEEMRNLSANQLAERGEQVNTLDERTRLEGFYWILSSGHHLDVWNQTLCAGSRDGDGVVPHVYWKAGRLRVDWYPPGYADGDLRARQVVPQAA